jgi:hypothetical protein
VSHGNDGQQKQTPAPGRLLGSFAFGGLFPGYIGLIDGGSRAPARPVALAIGLPWLALLDEIYRSVADE